MPTTQIDPMVGTQATSLPNTRETTQSRRSNFLGYLACLTPCSRPDCVVNTVVDPELDRATPPLGINLQQSQTVDEPISWQRKLQDWVDEAPETEKSYRQTASHRIGNCIQNNETSLDLRDLALTSLPDALVYCSNLEHLDCYSNKLQALPVLPSELGALICSNNPQLQLAQTAFAMAMPMHRIKTKLHKIGLLVQNI